MSTTTKPSTFYTEVEGPADKAAQALADRDLFILEVTGSNGCDFKNETAESYIVHVRRDHFSTTEQHYRLNLDLLTGYHVGDHDHYLAELRNEAYNHLRSYVIESTGLPTFVLTASLRKALNDATAIVDAAVDTFNETHRSIK